MQKSESIITNLRFQRSTTVPAKGLKITDGMLDATPTKTNAVVVPMSSYAQSIMANLVMRVAKMETNCPNQRI